MKTRKRKLYKGGEAIEGAQGCVVIPSLLVDSAMKTRNTSYVTKIFFKDKDFEEEREHNDMVMKTIDPRGTFTSAKYSTTPVDLRYLTPKEVDACSQLKGLDIKSLKFLNYKYLGKSINDIVTNDIRLDTKTVRSIITSVANLSVKLLYVNNDLGFFHNDVHEGNIMYNFKEEYGYLIDFGQLDKKPVGGNYLTDFQGIVTALRLFAITIVSQKRLPPQLIELLNAFIKDSSLTLTRAAESTDYEKSRELISKFLTDFSIAFTKTMGGMRRKTLRRSRN